MEIIRELSKSARADELFGPGDTHLRMIREAFKVRISARGSSLILTGSDRNVEQAWQVIEKLQARLRKKVHLGIDDVRRFIDQVSHQSADMRKNAIEVFAPKSFIEPYTQGQASYIDVMLKNDVTFCSGPAGSGKTYLAVAMAVSMLKSRLIRKIVLARPAVEAGEKLGFLPGDIAAKVNPYLRPLFDSLEDMMEFSQMRKFIEMDIIEVIPLAFMRGRTLNEAVVICDEAQNTTPAQMMMFLTRMGRGSKMIITGDLTQMDLAKGNLSGMFDAVQTLEHIPGIGIIALGKSDIVRHSLVQNIVQAYAMKTQTGGED